MQGMSKQLLSTKGEEWHGCRSEMTIGEDFPALQKTGVITRTSSGVSRGVPLGAGATKRPARQLSHLSHGSCSLSSPHHHPWLSPLTEVLGSWIMQHFCCKPRIFHRLGLETINEPSQTPLSSCLRRSNRNNGLQRSSGGRAVSAPEILAEGYGIDPAEP